MAGYPYLMPLASSSYRLPHNLLSAADIQALPYGLLYLAALPHLHTLLLRLCLNAPALQVVNHHAIINGKPLAIDPYTSRGSVLLLPIENSSTIPHAL